MSSIVEDLAAAIARQEGTGCGANNNPGNLRSWGTLPVSRGFAVFPTCEAGWEALRHQVQRNLDRGLTLEEFFGGKPGVYPGYAPAADNNQPSIYARNVSNWTGLPLGVPLNDLSEPGFQFFPDPDGEDVAVAAIAALVVGTVFAMVWL